VQVGDCNTNTIQPFLSSDIKSHKLIIVLDITYKLASAEIIIICKVQLVKYVA